MARLFERLDDRPALAQSSRFVFVSLDPWRDTPAQLSEYLAWFRPDFTGVTGAPEALSRLSAELAIPYEYGDPRNDLPLRGTLHRPAVEDYVVHHYAGLLLIDPDARLVATVLPPLAPERVMQAYFAIRKLRGDTAP
jgi:protein SCO1/2